VKKTHPPRFPWVVEDVNGWLFFSYLYPKESLNDQSHNCLLPAFGTLTNRNPPLLYRSCTGGYGRLRVQRVKGNLRQSLLQNSPHLQIYD
ncbi:hypothetical protein AVEN_257574-1, partial [Araneus ventricosus]